MGSLAADALAALSLHEPIFQSIKYFVTGDVPDKIIELLASGGAERTQYFSGFTTHLLCGTNPNETELSEATDLYEIPVVTSYWVVACTRLAKLVSPAAYNPTRHKFFQNVVACIAKVSSDDAKKLYALITYYGGQVQTHLDPKCTHFVSGAASGKKYTSALSLSTNKLKIVTPDWVTESIRSRCQAAVDVYHPKLIVLPQPAPRLDSAISAITGFDFEEGIAKNEVPTQNSAEVKDDSTQALLDKLKQRMPWNHPPTTVTGAPQTPSTMSSTSNTPIARTMVQSIQQNIQKTLQSSTMMPHQFNQTGNITQANSHMTQMQQLQQQQLQQQQMQQQQAMQQNHQNLQQNMQQNQQSLQSLQQNQHQSIQQSQQILQQQQGMQQNQQGIQQSQQSIQQTMQTQQAMQTQQTMQQTQQGQLHGLSAIQKQQQQLLQQRQFRMPMMHQNQNKGLQQQQVFHQQGPNQQGGKINQSLQGQMHMQTQQGFVQSQSTNQQTTTTLTQAQQIQNISQMLSQSTNNLQRAQLTQQAVLKQTQLTNQQQQQQQAVQNIAQHLAQSTQNLQQSQMLNQQQLLSGSINAQQSQGNIMQQQTVQSLGLSNQQQHLATSGQAGMMVQSPQTPSTPGTPQPNPGQPQWRQQNIQMIQNAQGQHQIIRGPLVQTRNPQNQMILQQQLIQNQQGIINSQQQSPQHNVQSSQQIIQQNLNSQGQAQHQILVQKQQLINGSQQQIVHAPQQVLINQHSGQQQIVVQGNQHVTLQGGQQIVSQQMMGQGGQILTQGGQHLVAQSSQHQVLIAQSSQQMVSQSGGPQIVQQQVLSSGGGPVHQIITHGGQQQLVSPGGQQIVQGQSISWQQQQYLQQRQQITQPNTPRVSWAAGGSGRQLIHVDAETNARLQQMDPHQRALFVAQLQKRRHLSLQRSALQQQQAQGGAVVGQAAGGGASPAGTAQSVTFIRGKIPPGLTQQQQVQWLQQQGARATTLPVTPPAQPPQSPVGTSGAIGGVGGASGVGAGVDTQLLHLQRQQHYQRLQQLRRREQPQGVGVGGVGVGVGGVVRAGTPGAPGAAVLADTTSDQALLASPDHQQGAGQLIVNPKTKTALANMLSIRLQSTGAPPTSPAPEHEPSAAGTLRLMTAAHAAAAGAGTPVAGVRQSPTRLLLHSTPLQIPAAPHAPGKVFGAAAVRAPPPRSQFYGHNPNLKLPPDLFLLGCVFHIVEYQQTVGAETVSRWSDAIARRGGEVEPLYCARVTHVLCETQRHGVVMQALRDAKRCVTAHWLSDAMLRRAVAPPWQALHLPTMYANRERPARHHRAAVSGWRGEERQKITFMLEHVGAKLTPYMSRDNTVLICKRPEGAKFMRARAWNVPVVCALWLTDLLLGNMSALSQIENTKYQQFNLGSPFRMDYALVSHLMNAWKMPINITQESHERAKRTLPAPPRRAKRPKLEPDVGDADSRPADDIAPLNMPMTPLPLSPKVLLSAVGAKLANKLSLIVKQLGGEVVTRAADATHLVMEKLVRTGKLLSALVTVKHLLTPAWLTDSQRQGKFADEAEYPLRDPEFDKLHQCDVAELLLHGEQRRRLLEGVTFFLTPCVQPSKELLTEVIELCGGEVDKKRKSYVAIAERHRARPNSYLVLTAPGDLHLVYYLLQPDRALEIVCSAEIVFASVLRQKLCVDEFLVKVD